MQWGVHLFPTQGEVGGYLSQTPTQQHRIIREVLCLWPYSFPARKQLSERRDAGSRAGTAPCPGCQELSLPCSSAGPRETVAHPQLLGALEWQQSPQAVVWDLLQFPTSGCCHSCPHHGPRANCKDEMVVVLSGLSWSHPFVFICARTILQGIDPSL